MTCEHCKAVIPDDSKTCAYCGHSTLQKEIQENGLETTLKFERGFLIIGGAIFSIPFILIGLFILIETTVFHIQEVMQATGYKKTTGVLVNYSYKINDTVGVYEYNVNGKNYYVSPEEIMADLKITKTKTVRYNPDSPEKSLIYANCWPTTLMGLGIIAIPFVVTVPGILIRTILLKMSKKKQ